MTKAIEQFKPIPVRRGTGLVGGWLFAARLAVDLQLLTCVRFLRAHMPRFSGAVLDVGCGEMPFRDALPEGVKYVGIDVPAATDFGMSGNPDIVAFDGTHIPFPDESFDHVLCTEVLEHAADPEALVREMHRVLRRGGSILVTVPFSARVHHAPWDFHRFTRYRLRQLFGAFDEVEVVERGNDIAVIANKLIVVCARLRRPVQWPLLLLAAPGALLYLAAAHLCMALGWGSKDDPLGYGVRALKGR